MLSTGLGHPRWTVPGILLGIHVCVTPQNPALTLQLQVLLLSGFHRGWCYVGQLKKVAGRLDYTATK